MIAEISPAKKEALLLVNESYSTIKTHRTNLHKVSAILSEERMIIDILSAQLDVNPTDQNLLNEILAAEKCLAYGRVREEEMLSKLCFLEKENEDLRNKFVNTS